MNQFDRPISWSIFLGEITHLLAKVWIDKPQHAVHKIVYTLKKRIDFELEKDNILSTLKQQTLCQTEN